LFGGIDRRLGPVERHVGVGSQPVIRDRFDIVRSGEETTQFDIELRLAPRQPGELGVRALVWRI
jgi:hypothetical protein